MKRTLKISSFFLVLLLCMGLKLEEPKKTTIAVAANLKPAMDSIITLFKIQNPEKEIQVIYGSSGKFYEQILHNAPFDIFFSADMNYPEQLRKKNIAVSVVKTYAVGRLALWSKKINPAQLQMNSLLLESIKKIAVANPVTAPYGARAIESITYFKFYDKVKNKLVYGENIAQTAQFVSLGAADLGMLALSECLSPNMKKEGGNYWIVPEESHQPLKQGCILLHHGKENILAKEFLEFFSSASVVKILQSYGYSVPKEK